MFYSSGTNAQQIALQAATFLRALRNDLNAAVGFGQWLAEVQDADLVAVGFTQDDVTLLRAAFADLATLYGIINGGAPPAAPYQYMANGLLVIGPQ